MNAALAVPENGWTVDTRACRTAQKPITAQPGQHWRTSGSTIQSAVQPGVPSLGNKDPERLLRTGKCTAPQNLSLIVAKRSMMWSKCRRVGTTLPPKRLRIDGGSTSVTINFVGLFRHVQSKATLVEPWHRGRQSLSVKPATGLRQVHRPLSEHDRPTFWQAPDSWEGTGKS